MNEGFDLMLVLKMSMSNWKPVCIQIRYHFLKKE